MRGRLAAFGFAMVASVIPAPTPAAVADQASVSMISGCATLSGYCFSPGTVTVPAGASVAWTNTTTAPHTSTSDGAGWDTGLLNLGNSASVIFTTPGSFAYHCSIHPDMLGTVVVTSPTFYFAEGYTGSGFKETLFLLMPKRSGTATIDYYLATGIHSTGTLPLMAGKVGTIDVNREVGPNQQVSVKVTLPGPGVVERVINFNTGVWHGSTDQVGVTASATEWDFAEGSTYDFFDEYLTLQNPNGSPVAVTLNYATDGSLTFFKTLSLPASSRTTVEVFNGTTGIVINCTPNGVGANCGVGRGIGGVSVQLKASMPIIAERPFYVNGYDFGDGVMNRDGHVAFGANALGQLWYFAEGTTFAGFREYLTLQNPGQSDTIVSLNYFTDTGARPVKTLAVRAHTRVTVETFYGDTTSVNNCVPNGWPNANCGVGPAVAGFSLQVSSPSTGIVVERPIYMARNWGTGLVVGAHLVVGANSLGKVFGFATASTVSGENDYLTILNPGSAVANVTATYYAATGPIVKNFQVAAGTRKTVEVWNSLEGAGFGISQLGIVVSSDQPILVEKPTYSSNAASYGATDTIGFSPASF